MTKYKKAGRARGFVPSWAWLCSCLLLAVASPAFAATKAIRAGKLIDPAGKVIANAVIVVDNDRITSIGTAAPPAGAEVIDLSRYTVIPGLIDLHTHMTYFWDRAPGTRPLGQPRRPAGVTVVLAAENARRTLETGVTTVRDLGASNEVDYAMRDLINMGKMIGPRMFVAGQGLSAPRAGAPARLSPAGRGARRGRIGLGQGLRLARQLPERRHDADAHVRRDEGGRRRRAREEPSASRFIPTGRPA